jgi:integrase
MYFTHDWTADRSQLMQIFCAASRIVFSGLLKFSRRSRTALKRAGIENCRRHDIRHTWASLHRQSGTPTHELQRLGGWRSSVMVERYAHLAPDHLAKAGNRLD